jgi:hypothetical protein
LLIPGLKFGGLACDRDAPRAYKRQFFENYE